MPWLACHNPKINWKTGEMKKEEEEYKEKEYDRCKESSREVGDL